MLKAQVLRRGFSLFRRVPTSQLIRSAARDGHETIHVQRVRFRKPFFTRSRLFGTALAVASAYQFLKWIDEDPEEVEQEEREREEEARLQVTSDGGEDEDDVEAILFLPTGFSRAKPRTFYKGSDPEWQEFVRMGRDNERTTRIRMELVHMVRAAVAKTENWNRRLGKIKTDVGSSWMQIKFPDGPPIEYERPGIQVTEDLTIQRTTRPVQEAHHQRLNNLLLPGPVANSLYVDAKLKATKVWQDFSSSMGWEGKSKQRKEALTQVLTPPSISPTPNPTAPTSTAPSPPGSVAAPSATSATQQQPGTQSSPSAPPKASSASTLGDSTFERFLPSLPPATNLTLDLSTFHRTFRKQHKHVQVQPPRGTFIVSGLVEVVGELATMTLDVSGVYDPAVGRYVLMKARVRDIIERRQYPKGGS